MGGVLGGLLGGVLGGVLGECWEGCWEGCWESAGKGVGRGVGRVCWEGVLGSKVGAHLGDRSPFSRLRGENLGERREGEPLRAAAIRGESFCRGESDGAPALGESVCTQAMGGVM